MEVPENVFERYEKKYLLDARQYEEVARGVAAHMAADVFSNYEIYNLYFDTPDFRLVRNSIEKPVYKEKLRLRCYELPKQDTTVFVELKKKYREIVYKRRVPMTYKQAYAYLMLDKNPDPANQILREIDWFKRFYTLRPAVNLSYHRDAFVGIGDPSLRVTFDRDIVWRDENIDVARGAYGEQLLDAGERLMELKTAGAIPLWLCAILNDVGAFPTSFSKYGSSYTCMLQEEKLKEVFTCA
ncbi:MAG: polyphosphate polymerase domain-containing protein [Oscillospiraceae bacterium]|nr:polyphosphate polymerase domain-containing protein [Oscillospiraceae bacterium]